MTAFDCKYFDGCSAPVCPKDDGAANTAWLPDEEICLLRDVPEWVKRQRKIAKKAAPDGGCFTLPMLERDCVIARGIKGIDPDGTDTERKNAEKAWLEKHPAITEEQREKMRAGAEKISAFRRGKEAENMAISELESTNRG